MPDRFRVPVRRFRVLALAGSILLSIMGLPVRGDEADAPAADDAWRKSAITSHQRNVIVGGMPRQTALPTAIWAENVFRLLQDWAGMPLPGKGAYPLVISGRDGTDDSVGRVTGRQQLTEDGFLRQELTVVDIDRVDREDLLEALVYLLANRWVLAALPAGTALAHPPEGLPAWLVVGSAQALHPDLINRNVRRIEDYERTGARFAASDVPSFALLPPGRWPEKAMSGLVVSWLAERISARVLLTEAARTVAGGRVFDLDAVLALTGFRDRKDMDMAWDVWMARRGGRIIPGAASVGTAELERILELRTDDIGLVHPDIPQGGRLSADKLIASREEAWARDAAAVVAWQLRLNLVGKTPEIQERVVPFLDILDQIVHPPPAPKVQIRKKSRQPEPPTVRELQRTWRVAASEWSAFLALAEQRASYLDAVEQVAPVTSGDVGDYLDQWLSAPP